MKKLITLLSLVTVFVTVNLVNSYSQVKFGPQVGLNMANVSGEDVENNSMKIGAHVGGIAEFMFTDMIGLRTGLLYSMKGAKLEFEEIHFDQTTGTATTHTHEFTQSVDYLEVPAMLTINLENGLNFAVGPTIDVLIAAKAKNDDSEENKDDFESLDLGAAANIGYRMENGLGFGAFANKGLMDIIKDNNGDAVTNIVFGVYVNMLFGGD